MSWFKRIFFFGLVNILVLITLNIFVHIVCAFMGVDPYGMNGEITGLLIFSAVFGMSGAFISLFMSKWMAKKMMGLTMIDLQTRDHQAREIVEMVHEMSRRAKLRKMPEVGIYNAPEMNAFATGPSKNNSLVAVSSGLVQALDRGELEAVIGHEVAHIANGDMVTMTLIQGVVNTFVIFFSRIVARIAASQVERNQYMVYFATSIITQIVFGILGSIVVAWFSRWREFRADAGGAKYSSRENMIGALQKLSRQTIPHKKEDAMAALKISGASGLMALMSTHPPLEKRVAALQKLRV